MSEPNTLGGAPNAVVATHATQRNALPMDEVALLGVAGPEAAMRALIRMSDGTRVTGELGDRIALGRLVEISPAGVVIEQASGLATYLRPYPWAPVPTA